MKKTIKNIPILGTFMRKSKQGIVSIKNYFRVKRYIKKNSYLKIVVGASNVYEDGWCPTDITNLNLLEIESFRNLFQNRKVDIFLAEHVWEHLTLKDGENAAKNCYSFLNSGGHMRIAVPDGFHKDKNYINAVDVGGSGEGSDDHKVLYNYKTLSKIFENAGFRVKLLEYFDEENNFHFNDWTKEEGMVHRSKRYDKRNKKNTLTYTSIIIDAFKVEQ